MDDNSSDYDADHQQRLSKKDADSTSFDNVMTDND